MRSRDQNRKSTNMDGSINAVNPNIPIEAPSRKEQLEVGVNMEPQDRLEIGGSMAISAGTVCLDAIVMMPKRCDEFCIISLYVPFLLFFSSFQKRSSARMLMLRSPKHLLNLATISSLNATQQEIVIM